MIIPIGDDQVKGGYYPLFSYSFLLINILVFILQAAYLSPEELEMFQKTFGSVPAETMRGEDLFTLFTSMFLHADWVHLAFNMLFLWVFADNIEATIGNFRFLVFYFLGGLAAHTLHIYFNMGSMIPTVGASGAIAAVMGAYLVMFPKSQIKILFLIFPFRVPAFLFLGFWIWQQWLEGSAAIGVSTGGGVAWWAHIGGFLFGLLAGLYYRFNSKPPRHRSGGREFV